MLYHIGLPLVRMWEERILTDVIVGLDIGTSNIRVAIGEVTEDDKVQIVGLATRPSNGVRNGTIINIEAAITAIKDAV